MVNWEAIPKEHHVAILETLAFGDCVATLPIEAVAGQTARIPLLSTTQYLKRCPEGVAMPVLEFEKVSVQHKEGEASFVWRRK